MLFSVDRTNQRVKGFICYSSDSSTYNMASICSTHQVYFCWKTVCILLTVSKRPRTRVQHGTIRPYSSCPNPLRCHQKASVLIVAITLIGLTLWANIPAIRYTSKHDCKHAPWHWVNMLAVWRNVNWDCLKACVSAATNRAETPFYKNLVWETLFTDTEDHLWPWWPGWDLHCSPPPFGDTSKWKIESY